MDQRIQEMLREAEAAVREMLAANPQNAQAWLELGMVHLRQSQFAAAEEAARKAIALDEERAVFWTLLGTVLFRLNRLDEAIAALETAVTIDPKDAAAWASLGAGRWEQDDLDQAAAAYQQSIELLPGDVPTLLNYGRLLFDRRLPEQAREIFEQVLALEPSSIKACLEIGNASLRLADYERAAAAYQRAIDLSLGDAKIRNRVVDAMARGGPPEQAEVLVEQLFAQEPRTEAAFDVLASLRQRQVRIPDAGTALRELLLLRPSASHHSNLLSLVQYGEGATLAGMQTYHSAWARAYAQPLMPSPPPRKREAGRRPLRLGFLSSDFGLHPTGFMVLPVLECLEKREFQITCYSDRSDPDALTARFKGVADHWRRTVKLNDEALAEQIRRDEIDILFDLMGHNGHRLLVFARKPAPMQVTWFGYVGTTGLCAMDYVLADRYHVVPGEESFYAERVLRMPHGYACYEPPGDSPEVGPLPALSNGHVTFGCLNNPAKIGPSILDCWARILGAVASATLLLKFRGYEQEQLCDRIKVEIAQRGINPARIRCEAGTATPEGMLAAYGRVDIALDTQPYSGGLTTCEALWMGVPVITFPGKTFAGRHATSHVTNAGLPQFVAADSAAYIDLAVAWANRLDELADLRGQMRNRLRQSALCDTHGFARDFAALLQEAWDRLPSRESSLPSHFGHGPVP